MFIVAGFADTAMIHLCDKGVVLGEFEESAVAGMLAAGKISSAAFFWREGMGEWAPVNELKIPPVAKKVPIPVPSPATPLSMPEAAAAKVAPADPLMAAAGRTKPFVPRRGPVPARTGSTPTVAQQARPMRSTKDIVPVPVGGGKSRRWLVWLAFTLLLLVGAGGGAWWWINREPPAIPGSVALTGKETSPVEIRVFRRDDLAAPWRERLSAADARGAELEKLLAEAQKLAREKSLLHEEAAKVLEVGEEYNMPDVAELRADRDAKQAEAEAAKADHDKLTAEKDSLLTLAGLLENLPAPVATVVADGQGNFALPPEEGEAVLLATTATGGEGGEVCAWLEVLETAEDGSGPEAVRFSETNRLDLGGIRNFAGAASP